MKSALNTDGFMIVQNALAPKQVECVSAALATLGGGYGMRNLDQCKRECDEITCLVPAGGVLLMRPLLLHASAPAKRPCHRRVVHLEYVADSLPGRLRWFEQMPARTAARSQPPPP